MSFHPGTDESEASDTDESSTGMASIKPSHLEACKRSLLDASHAKYSEASFDPCLEWSDNPIDDTDEDISNVPLDYGRSEKTKAQAQRIQHRWQR